MKIKYLTLAALFAALTFTAGFFRFPIGPVPVTLQTFSVIITGLLLPAKYALLAQAANLFLMLIFRSALGSPTFGFLIGFVLCAIYVSWMAQKEKNLLKISIHVLIGSLLIYVVGVPYFMVFSTTQYTLLAALNATFTPFLIGDALKAIGAIFIANRLKQLI